MTHQENEDQKPNVEETTASADAESVEDVDETTELERTEDEAPAAEAEATEEPPAEPEDAADEAVEEAPEEAPTKKLTIDDIDEEHATMDELMAVYEDTLAELQEGEIVQGVVVAVNPDEILVDVGYKSEGPIARKEFGNTEINVGDEVEVFLEKKEDQDGIIVLSKEKADFARTWAKIKEAYENDLVIEGRVVSRIKGGLEVDIGARGFLPASQVALRPVRNLEACVGDLFEMKVIKINRRRRNIVLSRKAVLQERRSKMKEELVKELEEGQIREGEVKNITDFGAFIDLGGIDGLLHITDMTWGRISHPSEMLSIGDEVKVLVLNFDRERERVSLGLKQLTPHPWKEAATKYAEGTFIRGKVVNMTDYGAFVELEDGIEGLIHISEMSWTQRIRHPSQLLNVSDWVDAKVLNLDTEKQRISLGLKQTEEDPWETISERFPRGTRLVGKVRNITDFGAFVEVDEGIDGLVHISDMSWLRRVRHPSEMVTKGQEIEVVVLNVDSDNRRISLGMKQLTEDPWEHIEDYIWEGAYVEGKVVRMARFGAIVELATGIEALLHISEIVDAHVPNVEDILNIGEDLTCKVININREERKVNLSLKAYNTDMGIGPENDPIMTRLIEKQESSEAAETESETDSAEDGSEEEEAAPEETTSEETTNEETEAVETADEDSDGEDSSDESLDESPDEADDKPAEVEEETVVEPEEEPAAESTDEPEESSAPADAETAEEQAEDKTEEQVEEQVEEVEAKVEDETEPEKSDEPEESDDSDKSEETDQSEDDSISEPEAEKND
ncbi:MAG: 30S ribosomal protein S1 [Candidatus Coatesbacteria bacterium]|nr:30S ribosomal protein S1 [Candidatus Coatesbacteria bacterium]